MKKIIVFGGGQVGSSVAKILSDDGNDITLVDYDKDVLTALKEKIDIKTIHGLASYPSVQKLADAEKRLEQYKIDGDTSKLQGIERKIEFYEKKLGIDSSSKFTDLSGRNETIQDYVSGYIPGDGKGGSTYSTSSDPHTGEPDFQTNREAWNEWNKKESQKLKDDPDSSGLDMF